ncbi:MAG: c-type cytochrome biogenesis protein CcmI [Alphaproteobacteria bacterium]
MTFWIIAAVLAVVTAVVVARPLLRRDAAAAARPGEHDVGVYREQLAALDRQVAAGEVLAGEAEALRAEIARRLLAAGARRDTAAPAVPERRWLRPAGAALLVLLPAAALAIYLGIGTPGMPDMPLAGRAPAGEGSTPEEIAGAVDRLAAHLEKNPDDLQGWVLLGRVHFAEQRFAESARAWSEAARLAPDDGELRATLGQALTVAANGTVTPEARAAFAAALERRPGDPRARYYLALANWQAGRRDEALAAWQALLVEAPPEAPWRAAVAARIAEAGGSVPPQLAQPQVPARGPSEADVAAAARMTPDERRQMIEGMVAGLAARLEEAPADVAGWLRLARAYLVLDRRDDAEAALGRALAADAGNIEALVALGELTAARGARDAARALFDRARAATTSGSPEDAAIVNAARAALGEAP